MWNVTESQCADFDAGDFVSVRGKCQLYQGGLQIILTHIRRAEPASLDMGDFELRPEKNVEDLLTRMKEILLGIDDPAIRGLMECFLIDDGLVKSLAQSGAGVKAHHAYPGGLVEHITNMLEAALRLDDLYPDVDGSLLLAGIFLHDLGKVREMSFESAFVYTDEGQLLGHMSIAVEMVTQKVAEIERMTGEVFPREIEVTTLRPNNNRFYWLKSHTIPDVKFTGAAKGITGTIKDGSDRWTTIAISSPARRHTVWLAPDMVDFGLRVQVTVKGSRKFNDFVEASVETIMEDLRLRGDRQKVYQARIELK